MKLQLKPNNKIITLSLIFYGVVYLFLGFTYPFWISLSIFFTVYALLLFIFNLSHSIAFRELAFFTATFQLLFGSLLAFYIIDPDPIFFPEGEPEAYFRYAIPAVIAFGLGLFTIKPSTKDIKLLNEARVNYNLATIGKTFIIFGLSMELVKLVVPPALGYFVSILGFLKFIGAFMMLFVTVKNKWWYIVLAFTPLFVNALTGGVFFLLLIWSAFGIIFFLVYHEEYSIRQKAIFIFSGVLLIFILDSAKGAFRRNIRNAPNQISTFDKALMFFDLYSQSIVSDDLNQEENLSMRVTRINQGAIVTWIMNYVPDFEDYAKGETVEDAIIGALVPRIFMPDKVRAGGVENYERFTGRYLRGTSINLSLIGEGYANFGPTGGVIFMYLVGLFYSLAYYWLNKYASKNPIYIFFIPFFFIYIIKAEDDLATPLNHIVKAFMVFIFLNQVFFKKYFKKNQIHA